jgi:hypothetical protein
MKRMNNMEKIYNAFRQIKTVITNNYPSSICILKKDDHTDIYYIIISKELFSNEDFQLLEMDLTIDILLENGLSNLMIVPERDGDFDAVHSTIDTTAHNTYRQVEKPSTNRIFAMAA